MLSDGVYDYAYDDERNLLRRTEIATGAVREFTWDHRNRLIAVTDKTAVGIPAQRVMFTYDAADRRISKAVDTTPLDAVITHFVYDREDVLLDFVDSDGAGPAAATMAERYFHGRGVDQVFAQDSGGGSVEWLLTDHLGSVRDFVNTLSVTLNHVNYDSFGNILSETNGSIRFRYSFTSRELDQETELYFYRARYLHSSVGNFLSTDPLSFASGDTNLYRYVFNSPTDSIDPLGLQCQKYDPKFDPKNYKPKDDAPKQLDRTSESKGFKETVNDWLKETLPLIPKNASFDKISVDNGRVNQSTGMKEKDHAIEVTFDID